MKFWKLALGLAAVASVVPYQVKVAKESDDEPTGKVTVKSLLYTIVVEPKTDENGAPTDEHDVSLIFPSDAVGKAVSCVKSKIQDWKAHKEDDLPEEELTVEIPAQELEEVDAL